MNADKMPRFSVLEWHDASEEPKQEGWVIASNGKFSCPAFWHPPTKQFVTEEGFVSVTAWAYLPTPGAGAATVQEVDACLFCSLCTEGYEKADWTCLHPEQKGWSGWWVSKSENRKEAIYPRCPLFHGGPHVVALTDAARKRLEVTP